MVTGETSAAQENGENSQNTPELTSEQETELLELRKKAELAENYRIRAEKAESANKQNKAALDNLKKTNGSLDVEDYIDISASLEGLDQREKSYLAEQHKLTGKPLSEIRKSEDFSFWDSAYKQKVEKDRLSLKPSGTQSSETLPLTVENQLKNAEATGDWRAEFDAKQKILNEAGLYKDVRPRADKTNIGGFITRP